MPCELHPHFGPGCEQMGRTGRADYVPRMSASAADRVVRIVAALASSSVMHTARARHP